MSRVTDGDLVQAAARELYSADPDRFIERRDILVAEARAAGAASAAKSIAALRKPTRSAWVLNQLVRAEPGATSQLDLLGDELRAAQAALDGTAIRELSRQRQQLIGALARRAFAASGLQSPPAALRDEVTATLGAAMADPQVAEQLRAGTLDRPTRRDGFGPGEPPALTLVPPAGQQRSKPAARRPAGARPRPAGHRPDPGPKRAAAPSAARQAAAPAKPADLAAAREKLERQRRREAVAAAGRSAAEADRAADAADRAEQRQEQAVRLIEEQLADARRDLADARLRARRARTRQRQAHQALGRLQD
jgi:hypothetical protein